MHNEIRHCLDLLSLIFSPAAHGVGISYGVGSGATAGPPATSVMEPKKPPAKVPVSAGQQPKPKVINMPCCRSLEYSSLRQKKLHVVFVQF